MTVDLTKAESPKLAQSGHNLRETTEHLESVLNLHADLTTRWTRFVGPDTLEREKLDRLREMAEVVRKISEHINATISEVRRISAVNDVTQLTAVTGKLLTAAQNTLAVQQTVRDFWRERITEAMQEAIGL